MEFFSKKGFQRGFKTRANRPKSSVQEYVIEQSRSSRSLLISISTGSVSVRLPRRRGRLAILSCAISSAFSLHSQARWSICLVLLECLDIILGNSYSTFSNQYSVSKFSRLNCQIFIEIKKCDHLDCGNENLGGQTVVKPN